MCGIQITKKETENQIQHRGVEHYSGYDGNWYWNFSSLPLSSNKTGLTQPINIESGLVLFNGEIFNYKSFGNYSSDIHYLMHVLKKGIEDKKFKKEYKEWDGFWAITIIMGNKIVFFTDPLGKKQLYYSSKGICSEIRPIIPLNSLILQEPQLKTLNTKFSNVYRAMAGFFYEYRYEDRMAYRIEPVQDYLSVEPELSSHNLISLIDSSVRLRSLTNFGKVGLLFSGGLDSSIIAYHLVKNKIDFTAISIENGETEYCESISKAIGFDVTYIKDELSEEEIIKAFKHYEHSLDMGSVIPQYSLFKKCKELGLHTVITGDGADELFGGYTRALTQNTFEYDVFSELPYYHHIRIDRMSMAHTVEARNPFLATPIIQYAIKLDPAERRGKKILKDLYRDLIPFVDRNKMPLRPKHNKEDNKKLGNKYFEDAFNN